MSQLLQSSIWQKIGYSGYSELVFAYGNKHSSISFPENFSNEEKMNLSDYYLAIEKNGLWF